VSPVELTDGTGIGGGGGGVKSYDGEKTWSSINHSILSPHHLFLMHNLYIVHARDHIIITLAYFRSTFFT
jgi:hypothetical protein